MDAVPNTKNDSQCEFSSSSCQMLDEWMQACVARIESKPNIQVLGRVLQVQGTLILARVPDVRVGELCHLQDSVSGINKLLAEVVGFGPEGALLSPLGPADGISPNTVVTPLRKRHEIIGGEHLFGRVLDGFGRPADKKPLTVPEIGTSTQPVITDAPPPVSRPRISKPICSGVRSIDALLTLGYGQRVGVFAGPGCGKTTLLASIARGIKADAIVFGLVGERGRELREFLEHELDEQLVKKSIVVCSTSDRSSMERARAAFTATALAEALCRQGKHVLLLIDSLTRFARAQREIGLAAGEPPAKQGYPPSVYSMMPRLIERAGNTENGSITAIYTILCDGDPSTDTIAEEARSLLDGHIILSRKLGEQGHYPAIDILASLSRVMTNLVSSDHEMSGRRLRALLAKYKELEMLIRLGEYEPGRELEADEAVNLHANIIAFLRQGNREISDWNTTMMQLKQALGR